MRWRVQAATQPCGDRGRSWVNAPGAPISDGKCAGVSPDNAKAIQTRLDELKRYSEPKTNILPLRRV